jgi:hypothetical protein
VPPGWITRSVGVAPRTVSYLRLGAVRPDHCELMRTTVTAYFALTRDSACGASHTPQHVCLLLQTLGPASQWPRADDVPGRAGRVDATTSSLP